MNKLLIASCLISVCYGGSLSGSYLPTANTGVIFGGNGLGQGSFGGLGSGNGLGIGSISGLHSGGAGNIGGVHYGGSGDLGGLGSGLSYYGDGSGRHPYSSHYFSGPVGVSRLGAETSYFPTISGDPKLFEYGDSRVLQSVPSNEIYFYGGPSRGDKTRLRIHLNPAPRKTNVLFVKSPEAGSSIIPEVIAPKSVSEERTSIFVLSKKPDALGSITVPSALSRNVVNAKPEVYYLKYQNPQEAEHIVADTLHGGRSGVGLHNVNKDIFVKTLVDDSLGGIGSASKFGGSTIIRHGGIGGLVGNNGLGSIGGVNVGGLGGLGGLGGVGITGGLGSGGVGVGGVGGVGSSGLLASGNRYGVPGASGPY
ncbi:hypothetical protein FQA39_LY05799 [Lamprigera yunnana]|nr:hypothetical protein FQA39_LY05799 [Lamprigera yunnana]